MIDVRAGVDTIDAELARLIGVRFRLMDAAARIKPERGQVRDEARAALVIAQATAGAVANCWSPELAREFWERLVEASIGYELEVFDRLNNAPKV